MNVTIIGANGFIGWHLSKAIIERTDWKIRALDLDFAGYGFPCDRVQAVVEDIVNPVTNLYQSILWADVVLPLAAIATPALYCSDPITVFQLDFEANLSIIKIAHAAGKRIIFPSTSEVYGMAGDEEFDEESTNMVLGPLHKERWIYASIKQLLERYIYALGRHGRNDQHLDFTIMRPFNLIGPRLDDVNATRLGSSRVVAKFIQCVLKAEPIPLVNGGWASRAYCYIDDAIDAIMAILHNKDGCTTRQVFNIGNPKNVAETRDIAYKLIRLATDHGMPQPAPQFVSGDDFYGPGYQDTKRRCPDITKAHTALGWTPTTDLDTALKLTLEHYLAKV